MESIEELGAAKGTAAANLYKAREREGTHDVIRRALWDAVQAAKLDASKLRDGKSEDVPGNPGGARGSHGAIFPEATGGNAPMGFGQGGLANTGPAAGRYPERASALAQAVPAHSTPAPHKPVQRAFRG